MYSNCNSCNTCCGSRGGFFSNYQPFWINVVIAIVIIWVHYGAGAWGGCGCGNHGCGCDNGCDNNGGCGCC